MVKRWYRWWKVHFNLPLLFLGVLCTLLLCVFVYQHTKEEMTAHVQYMGASKIAGLAQQLERYNAISISQARFVDREDGVVDPHRYYAQAKTLFDMGDALVYLGLAPDGVVTYEFPIHFLRPEYRDLRTAPTAERARWARTMHTPVSFFQNIPGGTGTEIVSLRPVYISGSDAANTTFWGWAILVVNEEKLMREVRLDHIADAGLYYTLTRRDGITGEVQVVDSNGGTDGHAVEISRLINSHLWTLRLKPVHGFADWRLLLTLLWAGLLTTFVISYMAETSRRVRREGRHDPLTGLCNRKGGDERVAAYMKANPHTRAAVLFMDIDNFKVINDVYGHEAGDRALRQFANDIRAAFGKEGIITRNGGDEFVVYLPYDAKEILFHRMDTFCHEPHHVHAGGRMIRFTSSMGCAFYPQHDTSYSQLCIKADFALYSAKLSGKAGWHLYNPQDAAPKERTQFGFNLSDIASGMPGAMMVYRAGGDYKILFASRKMSALYECDSYDDFVDLLAGDGRNMIHPDDRERVRQEIDKKERGAHAGEAGFITYHILTRKGNTPLVDTIGTLAHSALYGDVFYVSLYPHGLGDNE